LYAVLDTQGKLLGNTFEFTKDPKEFLKFLQNGKTLFNSK
jgi:hypothetical protein